MSLRPHPARRFRLHPGSGLRLVAAGALGFCLWLAGCATVGHDFPAERVGEIRLHETTQPQVREMFGEPWRVGIEDGLRTWTYGRYRCKLFGQASTKDLVLRFDTEGRVVSYTFNTTEQGESSGALD